MALWIWPFLPWPYDLRSYKAALYPVVLAFSHRAVSHLCGFAQVWVS